MQFNTKAPKLITVLGPTASGKTLFAAHLAKAVNGEIISADSRQLYRGMDIGTGKDLGDYVINGEQIPYHLIDICAAGDKYTLFDYHNDFHAVYQDIILRGKTPILCGGTGLYIESVLKGYNLPDVPANPELREELESKSLDELAKILSGYKKLHNTTDIENKKRVIRAIEIAKFQFENESTNLTYPPVESTILGLQIEREERRKKISARLKKRVYEEGMIEEVRGLINSGVHPDDLIYYGLEYKFVTLHLIGKLTFDEMYNGLEIAIHQFAKRQMTWLRGMERRGFTIYWIDSSLPIEEKLSKALSIIG